MPPRAARQALRPDRAMLGMRWLVLLVMMFATVISPIGTIRSHGLADMTAGLHPAAARSDQSSAHAHGKTHGHTHGLAHEDDDGASPTVSPGASVDHPHHGADHSHDKADLPPTAWRSVPPQLPGQIGHVRPWAERVEASRLERPPRG